MGLRELLGACSRRADFLLQPYFRLSRPLHAAVPGAGTHTAEQWGRERQALTGPFGHEDRYASDAAYRRYLAAIHEGKIRSVEALMRAFDFTRYPRIIELGCGDMPQAYTITTRHPAISYTATDFDPVVIERCAGLPALAAIAKAVLDVTRTDLEALGRHDLVASWSLEFALADAELERLFAACKRQRVPWLLCTHTAIGPIGWLAHRPRGREAPGMRRLGWLRSAGEVERLARGAGMALHWRGYHVNHAALFFTP